MSKLAKDSFLVITSKIISLFLGFISSIFFIRLIGSIGKGKLSKIEATAALLVLVTSLNLNTGIIHFIAKKIISKDKVLAISYLFFLFCIISSSIIIGAFYMFDAEQILLPKDTNIVYLILLLLFIITILLKEIFSSFLKGIKKFKDLYYSTLIYAVSRLIIFSTLFLLNKYYNINFSLEELISFHLLTLIILTISTFIYFKNEVKIKPNFHIKKNEIKPFIKYIINGLITLLIVFFVRKIDIWLIDYKLDTKQLGFYTIAIGLSDLILQLPMTLRNVLFPYLSSAKSLKEKSRLLALFSKINFTILLFITIILFFTAPFLIKVMYGDDYNEVVLPFKILIIGISFIGFKSFFQIYNMSSENQKYNIWINTISLALLITLDLYLLPKLGIVGASITVTVISFISSILIIYSVIVLQKLPKQNYFILTFSDIKKIKNLKFKK